jgi:hypothetical protein
MNTTSSTTIAAGLRPVSAGNRHTGWRGAARGWALLLLIASGFRLESAELTPTEFQAAFVSKAIPYVTWPEKTFAAEETPLVVGLFGGDPFDGLLHKLLATEKFEGRRIEVRVLDNVSRLEPCQVVFVGSEKLADWYALNGSEVPPGLLTIAADESGAFLRKGGLFNLRTSERKLEIDRGNLNKSGLKVSSKLLRIAKVQ